MPRVAFKLRFMNGTGETQAEGCNHRLGSVARLSESKVKSLNKETPVDKLPASFPGPDAASAAAAAAADA